MTLMIQNEPKLDHIEYFSKYFFKNKYIRVCLKIFRELDSCHTRLFIVLISNTIIGCYEFIFIIGVINCIDWNFLSFHEPISLFIFNKNAFKPFLIYLNKHR